MGKTGRKNRRYSTEFKKSVIMDMREHRLSYKETVRKYWEGSKGKEENYVKQIQLWERIFLEEGEVGFYIERRGRSTKMNNPKKGRPRKQALKKEVENDLIAELQQLKKENEYLRAENEYIKKLSALVRAEEQLNGKKRK